MNFSVLEISKEPPIAVIKLKRPEAMNALNSQVVKELVQALNEIETDEDVRCLVLTGDDRAFSAGADIKEMVGMSMVDMVKTKHFFPLWDKIGHYPKPIVAALSGYVLGGGLELAMSCDILVAAEGTRLGQPEINIGVMPGGGGTQRLTRVVGKYKAMEMILTGSMITAEEAKSYGLVNRVVPKEIYLAEAKKMAKEIAEKAPIAVRLAKEAVLKAYETSLNEGLDFERKHFFMLFSTEDMKEGMNAFIEKRKANFKGR
ncbi:MAG: enoyl-CoA hydratase-related protein [Conexivisphaerales archaeon]